MGAGAERRLGGPSADAAEVLSGAYQVLFQRVYEEVIREARAIVDALPGGVEVPSCDGVQQRIVDLVERLAGDALHLSDTHEKRVALYVIVATADEVFLRAPKLAAWPGREAWVAAPLELLLFRSRSSGERFFEVLDDALGYKKPISGDLLAVFLTALALGFCGKYADGAKPEGYRARVAERLHELYNLPNAGPDAEARADAALFHHPARVAAERAALPSVMNGVYPILAVVALWLFAGLVVWQACTYGLRQTLGGIEAAQ